MYVKKNLFRLLCRYMATHEAIAGISECYYEVFFILEDGISLKLLTRIWNYYDPLISHKMSTLIVVISFQRGGGVRSNPSNPPGYGYADLGSGLNLLFYYWRSVEIECLSSGVRKLGQQVKISNHFL